MGHTGHKKNIFWVQKQLPKDKIVLRLKYTRGGIISVTSFLDGQYDVFSMNFS